MGNFLRKLTFIQWYSIAMISWFTWGRIIALSHTDDIAREFLKNPITFIIATISVIYAIIVLTNKFTNSVWFITLTELLIIPHSYFMLFRGWVYFNNHSLVDLGYLILDAVIVAYFGITFYLCKHVVGAKESINIVTN